VIESSLPANKRNDEKSTGKLFQRVIQRNYVLENVEKFREIAGKFENSSLKFMSCGEFSKLTEEKFEEMKKFIKGEKCFIVHWVKL